MFATLVVALLIPTFTARTIILGWRYGTHFAEMELGEGDDFGKASSAIGGRSYVYFQWPTAALNALGMDIQSSQLLPQLALHYKDRYDHWKSYVYMGPKSSQANTPSGKFILYKMTDANGKPLNLGQNTVVDMAQLQFSDLQKAMDDGNMKYPKPEKKRRTQQSLSAAHVAYYDQYEGDDSYYQSIYGVNGSGDGYSGDGHSHMAILIATMAGLCLSAIVGCICCIIGGGAGYGVSNYFQISNSDRRRKDRVDCYDQNV